MKKRAWQIEISAYVIIKEEINVLCERDEFNDKLYTKLSDELEELDPYNDMFHLGCKNWPNCETEGCGEGEGYLI